MKNINGNESSPKRHGLAYGHAGKRQHNIINSLYIEPEVLEKTVIDRFEKYKYIEETRSFMMLTNYLCDDADIVVVAYGITARVARSAVRLARENGIKAGLFRLRNALWPFPEQGAYADSRRHRKEVPLPSK